MEMLSCEMHFPPHVRVVCIANFATHKEEENVPQNPDSGVDQSQQMDFRARKQKRLNLALPARLDDFFVGGRVSNHGADRRSSDICNYKTKPRL